STFFIRLLKVEFNFSLQLILIHPLPPAENGCVLWDIEPCPCIMKSLPADICHLPFSVSP
ncbi:hypothetical protein, partial [[Clostridium] innocuum]|uniref:hypothetical protein n=1 Tax=Clostridium innocuum TaxID=1522 RepID=UPI001C385692